MLKLIFFKVLFPIYVIGCIALLIYKLIDFLNEERKNRNRGYEPVMGPVLKSLTFILFWPICIFVKSEFNSFFQNHLNKKDF